METRNVHGEYSPSKRMLALALVVILLLSMLPFTVFADEVITKEVSVSVTDSAGTALSGVSIDDFTELDTVYTGTVILDENNKFTVSAELNGITKAETFAYSDETSSYTVVLPDFSVTAAVVTGGTVEFKNAEVDATTTALAGTELTVTVVVTPDTTSDYYLTGLVIGGVEVEELVGDDTYSVEHTFTSDTEVVATFTQRYELTFSGENYSYTDSTDGKYDVGSEVIMTATTGYYFDTITIDQIVEQVDASTYSFDVSGKHEIVATTVANGTVNVTENFSDRTIDFDNGSVAITGEDDAIAITPNYGYRVSKVTITPSGSESSTVEYSENSYTYTGTLTSSVANTIEVEFALNEYTVTTSVDGGVGGTFTETISAVTHGATDVEISMTQTEGYYLAKVEVDNFVVETTEEPFGNYTYILDSVTADVSIVAYFEEIVEVDASAAGFDASAYFDLDINTSAVDGIYPAGTVVTITAAGDYTDIGMSFDDFLAGSIVIEKDTEVTGLYLSKITDGVRKVIYIENIEDCDYVIDAVAPVITFVISDETAIYGGDIELAVTAADTKSNISEITYTINGGDPVEVYVYSGEDKATTQEKEIIIDSATYFGEEVVLVVTSKDVLANTSSETKTFSIDTTAPEVDIELSTVKNELAADGEYYNTRTVSMEIKDEEFSFNKTSADAIISVDGVAQAIEWTYAEGVYSGSLSFTVDGTYTLTFSDSYESLAGHSAEISTEGTSFIIDNEAPTGTLTWEEVVAISTQSLPTFEYFSTSATVKAYTDDTLSGVQSVTYYTDSFKTEDNASAYTLLTDEALAEKEFTSDVPVVSDRDGDGNLLGHIVYAKLVDNAGNVSYISTNGAVVDVSEGTIGLASTDTNKNIVEGGTYDGFIVYTGDVTIDVSVNDALYGDGAVTSAGIDTITYTIDGVEAAEALYDFDIVSPSYAELETEWSGTITVPSSLNKDGIEVVVTVTDNAGNVYSETIVVNINMDTPTVTISFDKNDGNYYQELDNAYYNVTRTATITVIDRDSVFDEASADGIVKVNGEVAEISEWTYDATTVAHTATITFSADANYELTYTQYENKIGKIDEISSVDGTSHTANFTVDKTAPTGSVSLGGYTWDGLQSSVTYGIFNNESLSVTATSNDNLSGVLSTEMYVSNSTTALSVYDLNTKEFTAYNETTYSADNVYVVYIKITDLAGNVSYISTNGFIVDKTVSNVTISTNSETSAEYTFTDGRELHNSDIVVDWTATEPDVYSGISTIDYTLTVDGEITDSGNLFTFDDLGIDNPTYSDLVKSQNNTITIEAVESCDITLTITTTDMAGNVNTVSKYYDIDLTAPTIDISFDNTSSNVYFRANRTATITIVENDHHFGDETLDELITVSATLKNGSVVSDSYTVSAWEIDGDTHTATIEFTKDAIYTFDISYTDLASWTNEEPVIYTNEQSYSFVIDRGTPSASVIAVAVEGDSYTWSSSTSSMTYGIWSQEGFNISSTSSDTISSISSVLYKIVSGGVDSGWLSYAQFEKEIRGDQEFVVYVKVTDAAGNSKTVSTDSLIIDSTAPAKEVVSLEEDESPVITLTVEENENYVYNNDVTVNVQVKDTATNDAYSGLSSVTYSVYNGEVSVENLTQSGALYAFDVTNPSKDELLQVYNGNFVVDSSLNNSNEVTIVVTAIDNAGNVSEEVDIILKVDITAPVISISYDNNDAENEVYFEANRTATISISERNFDSREVTVTVVKDGVSYPVSPLFTRVDSGDLSDSSTWVATVDFDMDGDYTLYVSCTDQAGNVDKGVNYVSGTVAGGEFTIDKTMPVVSVSYNNNSAQNSKYFSATRTATVVVIEHNFDEERANLAISSSTNQPSISAWQSDGDYHVATISYYSDGDYTFSVSMTDLAGNQTADVSYGTSVAGQSFTIDTYIQKPVIEGVEDGMSYKGEISIDISFSDTNYYLDDIDFSRTRAYDKDISMTDILVSSLTSNSNGFTGNYSEFSEVSDIDGIYTLTVTVYDLAGNTETASVEFVVNRFGSVYAFDDYLIQIDNNDGYVGTVDSDIIITEYNPDKLTEGSVSVTITHDGSLMSNVIYEVTPVVDDSVSIGDSGWYQYQYIISKDNFTEDGIYKIALSSVDELGNISQNINIEDFDIAFYVDGVSPQIASVTGLEDSIVNAQQLEITYNIFDAVGLRSLIVMVDGEPYGDAITDFGDRNNYTGTLVLSESSKSQTVSFVITDMAYNVTDTGSTSYVSNVDFVDTVTISTNMFVRFMANTPLLIGCGLLLAGVVFGGVYYKKKRNAVVEG